MASKISPKGSKSIGSIAGGMAPKVMPAVSKALSYKPKIGDTVGNAVVRKAKQILGSGNKK